MSIKATSDLWWKNAVIYCLDVETYADSNEDGCGDFPGLTKRVDYLAGLGVTCLWLMPFYPSPNRDDGYDITDFYNVDPKLGSLGDFVEFVRTARERGMRVIVDLVVNHTSDQHPWFQAARKSRDDRHRDYYVWRDERPEDGPEGLAFPGVETSNWEWDEEAGQYYLHRFYSHQPDLNVEHPGVRDEIDKIMGFWLELGVSGFRIDAVPFLLETEGIDNDINEDPHEYLRDFRAFLSRRRGDAIMLGEVNREPEGQRRFFGDEDGDELHMIFNFVVNQNMYLALARQDATPLKEALQSLPEIPESNQWVNFVRNHDELTLDKLSDKEREEVFAAFGPDEKYQLYGRGLRRRVPTMFDGDARRIALAYSLMFSLPGTPTLFYGEEIGMAENLDIEGRYAVRTPMQWSNEPNAGFSRAPASALRSPIVDSETYGPRGTNAADQRRDRDSLLNWAERLIRQRKECPELGWGAWRVLDVDQPCVFAHRCDWEGSTVLALHNLSSEPCSATLDADDLEGLVDLFADGDYEPPGEAALEIELEGYGYRWFRVRQGIG